LIDTVICGGREATEENEKGYIGMPEYVHADFAVRCEGDSLTNSRVFDGDIVLSAKRRTTFKPVISRR
jgi:repressor LexA